MKYVETQPLARFIVFGVVRYEAEGGMDDCEFMCETEIELVEYLGKINKEYSKTVEVTVFDLNERKEVMINENKELL